MKDILSFQFQNGTIDSFLKLPRQIGSLSFQFQNGTIDSFYSKFLKSFPFSFQFQNGTIDREDLAVML